jgi:hypothetical protein
MNSKKSTEKSTPKNTISLGTFEQWCKDRSDVPDDEDKGFVAGYYVCYDDDDDDGEEKDDDEDIDENENDGKKYRAFFYNETIIETRSSFKQDTRRCYIQISI